MSVVTEFEADEARVTSESEKFSSFPAELSDPEWAEVTTVFDSADEAGTRGDFVAEIEDAQRVQRFYADSRDKIRQKVIGAANYALKQKTCDVEVSGPIASSLDKSIERELKERIRASNPAHRHIADKEEKLGTKNVEKLGDQADSISELSYIVRTKMPQAKQDLEVLVNEEAAVRRTLELEKSEAEVILDDVNASKRAKERAKGRAKAATDSLARFDADLARAKELLPKIEERGADAKKRYQKAFDLLQVAVEDKADEAREKAEAEKAEAVKKAVQ